MGGKTDFVSPMWPEWAGWNADAQNHRKMEVENREASP
jgi:hypothetical protein